MSPSALLCCDHFPYQPPKEQTLCATAPVATRMARSARKYAPAASGTATTNVAASHLRLIAFVKQRVSSTLAQRQLLACLLRSPYRGQRLHGYAGRRHIVIGHEKI
jgi:hypothetical protein